MNDVIVTIRMPQGMVEDLKKASQREHFLDLSETIRSIIRRNWLIHTDPYLHELKALREEITSGVREKSQKMAGQMLVDELKKIRKGLNDEK